MDFHAFIFCVSGSVNNVFTCHHFMKKESKIASSDGIIFF
jgi:hypothetical protein